MAAKERVISALHGPITTEFLDEVSTYNLKFTCESCTFFVEETGLCAHKYPNEPHRAGYFADEPLGKVLIFCRDFELHAELG